MTVDKKPSGTLVAAIGEIEPGKSRKFRMKRGNRELEAFLVNYQGNHFAFINRCPHTGIALDFVDNLFFSSDERYVMCATHGAVFEPPTGECIWGPCVGLSLQSCPVEIADGQIYARLPGSD